MAVRTTVDIPDPLHQTLRKQSERSGVSVRSLIIRAIEQAYSVRPKGKYVKSPPVAGPGKLGKSFPKDENPHDLVFS